MSPDSQDSKAKWNARYADAAPRLPEPAAGLREHAYLLPSGGRALDVACGRGGNALFLAGAGFATCAWDISDRAIEQLQSAAAGLGLTVDAAVRDVVAAPPEPESFDVIVVSRFLERGLMPDLLAALKPGALLVYQTFIRDAADPDIGPRNPDYRLGANELLRLCAGLQVLVYREEGTLGDVTQGWRNEALLIGRRDG